MKPTPTLFVDRNELVEHRHTGFHQCGCGICGKMCNTRDKAKICFYSHSEYVSNGSTADKAVSLGDVN